MDAEEPEFTRSRPGGRSGKTAMGSKRSRTGSLSGRGYAHGRQYSMDNRLGERVPGARIRRDERSPADAREGSRHRKSKNQLPSRSEDRDSAQRPAGNRNSASESRRCLCSLLRPDCRVWGSPSRLSLLSLHLSRLRARYRLSVGRWNRVGCRRVGRLGRQLGQL
jgi:hypothetical protein